MQAEEMRQFQEEICWHDGQWTHYEGLWLKLAAPVRIEITVDTSMPRQSSATAHVFSQQGMMWNQLATIPYPLMCSPDTLSKRPFGEKLGVKHFTADKVTLMIQARDIIGDKEERQ